MQLFRITLFVCIFGEVNISHIFCFIFRDLLTVTFSKIRSKKIQDYRSVWPVQKKQGLRTIRKQISDWFVTTYVIQFKIASQLADHSKIFFDQDFKNEIQIKDAIDQDFRTAWLFDLYSQSALKTLIINKRVLTY